MAETLIAPRFLFRFSVPLRRHSPLWSDAEGVTFGSAHRLAELAALDGERSFADIRGGWSEAGLAFTASVLGKRQALWCRDTRPEDSDALHLWIDTRDTHTIHRATRFCHRFVFMPAGGGREHAEPVAEPLVINRARENPPPGPRRALQVRASVRSSGYDLAAFIPAAALTGFAPAEHPRLGFTYALFDRELGLQAFSVGSGYPFDEDPSTWGTLELTR